MSWLKKVGTILVKAAQIIVGVQQILPPGVVGIMQSVEDVLAQALQVIVDVEAMGAALALTGPQKLQAAVAAGTQIFLRWSAKLGRKINDQALFTAGVTQVFDGLVKIANSWKADVDTKDVT
jgi:hypothetical protein